MMRDLKTRISNKRFFILLFFPLLLAGAFTCKKNQLGGKSSIHASVEHHGKHIANSRIFVKFNAKEFPGKDTSVYDARIQADAEGHAIINCYKGEYFLYGMGFDAGVPGKVSGGLHVKVRTNEEIHTEVPVTED